MIDGLENLVQLFQILRGKFQDGVRGPDRKEVVPWQC